MQVEVGQPVTATLVDPGSLLQGNRFGARIEMPVTRAIVSYWREAVLDPDEPTWTVILDAPPALGDYELVWRTDDAEPPAYETYVPLFVLAEGALASGGIGPDAFPALLDNLVSITPTADDVAALERTRTNDKDGNDQGTFNSLTTPTDQDVDKLIEQAIYDVVSQLDEAIDPAHYDTLKRAVTLNAAILVEGSFFRDDINTETVALYGRLAADALKGVQDRSTVEVGSGPTRLV